MLGPPRVTSGELAPVLYEVDENVVAEGVGRGEKGPATVELSDLLDEVAKVPCGVEGKGVDADPLS